MSYFKSNRGKLKTPIGLNRNANIMCDPHVKSSDLVQKEVHAGMESQTRCGLFERIYSMGESPERGKSHLRLDTAAAIAANTVDSPPATPTAIDELSGAYPGLHDFAAYLCGLNQRPEGTSASGKYGSLCAPRPTPRPVSMVDVYLEERLRIRAAFKAQILESFSKGIDDGVGNEEAGTTPGGPDMATVDFSTDNGCTVKQEVSSDETTEASEGIPFTGKIAEVINEQQPETDTEHEIQHLQNVDIPDEGLAHQSERLLEKPPVVETCHIYTNTESDDDRSTHVKCPSKLKDFIKNHSSRKRTDSHRVDDDCADKHVHLESKRPKYSAPPLKYKNASESKGENSSKINIFNKRKNVSTSQKTTKPKRQRVTKSAKRDFMYNLKTYLEYLTSEDRPSLRSGTITSGKLFELKFRLSTNLDNECFDAPLYGNECHGRSPSSCSVTRSDSGVDCVDNDLNETAQSHVDNVNHLPINAYSPSRFHYEGHITGDNNANTAKTYDLNRHMLACNVRVLVEKLRIPQRTEGHAFIYIDNVRVRLPNTPGGNAHQNCGLSPNSTLYETNDNTEHNGRFGEEEDGATKKIAACGSPWFPTQQPSESDSLLNHTHTGLPEVKSEIHAESITEESFELNGGEGLTDGRHGFLGTATVVRDQSACVDTQEPERDVHNSTHTANDSRPSLGVNSHSKSKHNPSAPSNLWHNSLKKGQTFIES